MLAIERKQRIIAKLTAEGKVIVSELSKEFGVTDSNENDCMIKKVMIASAERRILALDSEKFDKKSFVRICEAVDMDMVVTDRKPDEKWIAFCEKNGIELIYPRL